MPTNDDRVPISVLLVDDKMQLHRIFESLFKTLRFDPELEFVQPVGGTEDVLSRLPREAALDRFDVALVDLELYHRPIAPVRAKKKDLEGGTKVLPYLRLHAPWLPVIAQTQLITDKALHLLSIIGSFGFDGLLSQALLPWRREEDSSEEDDGNERRRTTLLDLQQWTEMMNGARLLRHAAVLGPSYDGATRLHRIDISPALRSALDDPEAFEALLKIAFHFATDISVEALAPGHSGAQVFKAVVSGGSPRSQRPGYWLVKVSNSPSKLHTEVTKHLEMMFEGIEYGVAVPLLWRGVLVEKRKALIAYKFAEDTVPASHQAMASFDAVAKPIARILRRYYGRTSTTGRQNLDTLLNDFGPWPPNLAATFDTLPDEFRRFSEAVQDRRSLGLAYIVDYRELRIHGDLHLDNVMLGGNSVLIDFSKTKIGPVAADAAKLVSDLLIRFPHLRHDRQPAWNDRSPVMAAIRPLHSVFKLQGDGDKRLFTAFLSLFLWEALFYDTTDETTKIWIKTILATSEACALVR